MGHQNLSDADFKLLTNPCSQMVEVCNNNRDE